MFLLSKNNIDFAYNEKEMLAHNEKELAHNEKEDKRLSRDKRKAKQALRSRN